MARGMRPVALVPTASPLLPGPPDILTAGSRFASFCDEQNRRFNRTRRQRAIELPALTRLEPTVAERATASHNRNAGQWIHQHDALFGGKHLMGDAERDGVSRQRCNGLRVTDHLRAGAFEPSGVAGFGQEWRMIAFRDLNDGQAGSRSVKRSGFNEEHVTDGRFNPAQHLWQSAVQCGAPDLVDRDGTPEAELQP